MYLFSLSVFTNLFKNSMLFRVFEIIKCGSLLTQWEDFQKVPNYSSKILILVMHEIFSYPKNLRVSITWYQIKTFSSIMHHPINSEFFRTHYRPVADSVCNRNDYLWVKVAGAQGWQPYHLHVPIVYKFWEPQTPGAVTGRSGLYRDKYTFCINISTFSHRIRL